MSDNYTPAPQTFEVRDSPSYMERPITVTATAHLNADHSMATKITLTRAEAYDLVSALMLYLTREVGIIR